jgi:hypothetical protein
VAIDNRPDSSTNRRTSTRHAPSSLRRPHRGSDGDGRSKHPIRYFDRWQRWDRSSAVPTNLPAGVVPFVRPPHLGPEPRRSLPVRRVDRSLPRADNTTDCVSISDTPPLRRPERCEVMAHAVTRVYPKSY